MTFAVSEQLVISAARYALGVQTYIVATTVDELVRIWTELSEETRALIVTDIIIAAPKLNDIDRERWKRVVTLGIRA
jgi:hypothetical protein